MVADLETLFSNLRLFDVHTKIARNIISLRQSENLFDDLSDDLGEQQIAMQIEMDVKPPHYTIDQPIINRPFEEAALSEAVDYPFKNWTKSRYSNGTFGIWCGADTVETSVHETVYHWRRFLSDADYDTAGSVIERKVWYVQCDAALVDLRPLKGDYPQLLDQLNYDFTQAVGGRLHREGHPGLISVSARCDGDVYGVLNKDVLSNPENSCYLTYRLSGSGGVEVERTPGKVWLTV